MKSVVLNSKSIVVEVVELHANAGCALLAEMNYIESAGFDDYLLNSVFRRKKEKPIFIDPRIRVNRFTKNGTYIMSYNSIGECERLFSKNVRRFFSGEAITINGCIFTKGDNLEPPIMRDKIKRRFVPRPDSHVPVDSFDLNGNYLTTYKTTKEAAIDLGVSRTHISSVLHGRKKTAAGVFLKFHTKK